VGKWGVGEMMEDMSMDTTISEHEHRVEGCDEEGYLTDPNLWNETLARQIAEEEGIPRLNDEQLEIIQALREHYLVHSSFPILASICRKAGSRTRDCVYRAFMNPMKAWKIAGLPKPPNVFFNTFDGKKFIPNPFY
jgi:tRNA 2-thiouridine synthesizing protein E